MSHELSYVKLFVTLWTVALQAPLSMGILQARILEWLPSLPPGDLPDPGMHCLWILYQLSYQGSLSIINLFHLMGVLISVKQLKEYGSEYYLWPLRRN